jgi:hypothetical protein
MSRAPEEGPLIILRDIPFPRMAKFLHDNVCGLPPDVMDSKTAEGLREFHRLLRNIYADTEHFRKADDKLSYAALMNAVSFLFGCFVVGKVERKDGRTELLVDKQELAKTYRGGNTTGNLETLGCFGLQSKFLLGSGPCGTLRTATGFALASPNTAFLLPATKRFAELIEAAFLDTKDRIYGGVATFFKGDYATAIGLTSISRSTLDPMRPDILRTVGRFQANWTRLVDVMMSRAGWSPSGFLHYGFSPAWGVSFAGKRQRPTAIFTIGSEALFIEFTLPLAAAKCIILKRSTYAQSIRQRIESFKCVQCPKKCRGENLTSIDGVRVCTGRAEARRIYMYLSEPDEFESIEAMVETICRGTEMVG